MDKQEALRRVAEANRLLVEGRRTIDRQRDLSARLERTGIESAKQHALLTILVEAQADREERLAQLLDWLESQPRRAASKWEQRDETRCVKTASDATIVSWELSYWLSISRLHPPAAQSQRMASISDIPLDRAQAKLGELERQLSKCPDFQLYLIANSSHRARMKQILMEIPSFRLWSTLTESVERALRQSHTLTLTDCRVSDSFSPIASPFLFLTAYAL